MNESKEVVLWCQGSNIEADMAQFLKRMHEIETRHLPYFIGRPGIFEDDAHERLKDHFFFLPASGKVILKQAESSVLPSKILAEVASGFFRACLPCLLNKAFLLIHFPAVPSSVSCSKYTAT